MAKMSDERKGLSEEELISINTAVFQSFLSSCNYKETSKKYHQACQQIHLIIEYYFNHLLDEYYKKPEFVEKYVEEKARKIGRRIAAGAPLNAIKDEITQIISDARGGGIEVGEDFIRHWTNKLFSRYRISIGVEDYIENLLKEAGVKIK